MICEVDKEACWAKWLWKRNIGSEMKFGVVVCMQLTALQTLFQLENMQVNHFVSPRFCPVAHTEELLDPSCSRCQGGLAGHTTAQTSEHSSSVF